MLKECCVSARITRKRGFANDVRKLIKEFPDLNCHDIKIIYSVCDTPSSIGINLSEFNRIKNTLKIHDINILKSGENAYNHFLSEIISVLLTVCNLPFSLLAKQ